MTVTEVPALYDTSVAMPGIEVKERLPQRILQVPSTHAGREMAFYYPDRFRLGKDPGISPVKEQKVDSDLPFFRIKAQTDAVSVEHSGGVAFWKGMMNASLGEAAQELQAHFTDIGIMLDYSRGAVFNEGQQREIVRQAALLGINAVGIYQEVGFVDPSFGAINRVAKERDQYSREEIQDFVRYGREFGVEIYPCIQTFAHLEHLLKQPEYRHFRFGNTDSIVDPTNPDVYSQLLRPLINGAVQSYMQPDGRLRLQIGFDEVSGITNQTLFIHHLERVIALCHQEYEQMCTDKGITNPKGLDLHIWGEYLLELDPRLLSTKRAQEVLSKVKIDYWNYDHTNEQGVLQDFATYDRLGIPTPSVAGSSFMAHNQLYPFTKRASKNILGVSEAARQRGIQGVMGTYWGDNAGEAPYIASLPNVVDLAGIAWDDLSHSREVIHALSGTSPELFAVAAQLNALHEGLTEESGVTLTPNPSKGMVYDNPQYGLPLTTRVTEIADPHFSAILGHLSSVLDHIPVNGPFSDYVQALTRHLRAKVDFARNGLREYNEAVLMGDSSRLQALLYTVQSLEEDISYLDKTHRAMWEKEKKPAGFQTIEQRYQALQSSWKKTREQIAASINDPPLQLPCFTPAPIETHFPNSTLNFNRAYALRNYNVRRQ
jgi:hypothetical protein